jgi:hypothetical protein
MCTHKQGSVGGAEDLIRVGPADLGQRGAGRLGAVGGTGSRRLGAEGPADLGSGACRLGQSGASKTLEAWDLERGRFVNAYNE